jgi:hypothetical protein
LDRPFGDGLFSSSSCVSGVGANVVSGRSVCLAHYAMKKLEKGHPHILLLLLIVLGLSVFCLSGCRTARGSEDENGSDLPWNTPQPWEGAPAIPGLDGMGR